MLIYKQNISKGDKDSKGFTLEILWNCFNWGSQTKIYDTFHEDGDQEEEENEQEVVGQ